jgi:ferric-dicitrate binding protein FerR (iron transport regulator)
MNHIMQDTALHPIVRLILAAQSETITAEQQQELDAWARTSETNQAFVNKCLNRELVAVDLERLDGIDDDEAWKKFIAKNGLLHTPVVPMRKQNRAWRWLAAAAVALIALSAGWWWMSRPTKEAAPVATVEPLQNDIQPGSQKATLTLSSGKVINLDQQQNGTLAKEGGSAVTKQGGELVYSTDPNTMHSSIGYHEVSTPTGGFYTLVLPDKSKVWLNAESSISYPTAFTGPERRVKVTGEAYFEVAKNAAMPFVVSVHDMQVKVLGTHFNVNGYGDLEQMRTTLLEGRVEVSTIHSPNSRVVPGNKVVLSPGQQSLIDWQNPTTPNILVQTTDVESVVAWKDGNFAFKAAAFTDVMREIKRWYDGIEEVEIRTTIPDKFTATMPRTMTLANMLKVLEEASQVKFTIEGKKIIVTK